MQILTEGVEQLAVTSDVYINTKIYKTEKLIIDFFVLADSNIQEEHLCLSVYLQSFYLKFIILTLNYEGYIYLQ